MMPMQRSVLAAALLLAGLPFAGCGQERPASESDTGDESAVPSGSAGSAASDALGRALAAARAGADSVVALLQPVALMTPAAEGALRRYDNDAHLARARALGARPSSDAERDRFVADGRLVAVPDSTDLFVLRERDPAGALLTPDALELLERIATRFQAAMTRRGLPAYRIEVSSLLRTSAEQAALRRVNPNAAAGTSTHEFGTTFDVVYESWAAPAALPESYAPREPAWVTPHADAAARAMLEWAAARKSRELTAILGGVLAEMQSEGIVYVTLERQQPVFHVTVARRLAE